MKRLGRHMGVFFIGFAASFLIADRLPEYRDATDIYLGFAVLFIIYLGADYLWLSRRVQRRKDVE
jgi:hypothetical protein